MQASQTIQPHPVALAQTQNHRYTHLMRRLYLPPVYWRDAFCDKGNELKAEFQTDTIKTWEALLVELCERKFVVKDILRHFLSWLPSAKNRKYAEDGVVFKKATDWLRETGISENQMSNKSYRKVMARIGIVVFNGVGNIMHFKLDPEAFTRAIAKVLGLSYILLKSQIWSVFSQLQPVKSQNRPVESGKPLTDSTTQPTTKTNYSESVETSSSLSELNLLKSTKLLSENECKRFAASLSTEIIQACIDSLETADIKTSRRAYFRAALKKQIEEQAEKKRKQSQNPFAGMEWSENLSEPHQDAIKPFMASNVIKQFKNLTHDNTETKIMGNNPIVCGTMTASDAWNATYNQLELQLNKTSFGYYLHESNFKSFEDDTFIIAVKTPHQQEILQGRLYRNVCRVLADVLGKKLGEVTIRFEIQKGI